MLPEHPDANLRPVSFQRTSRHGVYLCTLCPDLRTGCLSVVSLYVSPLFKKERLWQEPLRYPVSCTLQTLLLATTEMIVPQWSNLSGICLKTSLSSPTVEGVERRWGVTWATFQSQTNCRPMSWLPLDGAWVIHPVIPIASFHLPFCLLHFTFHQNLSLYLLWIHPSKLSQKYPFSVPWTKLKSFFHCELNIPWHFQMFFLLAPPPGSAPVITASCTYLLMKMFPRTYSVSVCTKWLCQKSSISAHCIHRPSVMSLGSYSKGKQETHVFCWEL